MQFNNYTPFAAIAFENLDATNKSSVTTVARVKYKLLKDDTSECTLILDPDQEDLFASDVFYGEVGESSVRFESDYVSFKPNSDVIVNAIAYAPQGRESVAWPITVNVYDANDTLVRSSSLMAKGEKQLTQVGPVWSNPLREKAHHVDVRYERAYGGTVKKESDEGEETILKSNLFNPVGCGLKKFNNSEKYIMSPQITYLNKAHKNIPAGFGCINRAWSSRVPLAGTYDEAWIENQHPLPPHDFDYAYNQAAHPELIMQGYLKSGSTIELINLMPGKSEHYFKLPSLKMLSRIRLNTGDIYQEMNLDTVIVDIDTLDTNTYALYLSYRALTPITQEVEEAEVMLVPENTTDTDTTQKELAHG